MTICLIEVEIFTVFLQVQNQNSRAVETSCQGPAGGRMAELGTGSATRFEVVQLCHHIREIGEI